MAASEGLKAEAQFAALTRHRLDVERKTIEMAEERDHIEQLAVAEIEARMDIQLKAIEADKECFALEQQAKEVAVAKLKITEEAIAAAKIRREAEERVVNMAKLRIETENRAAELEIEKYQAEEWGLMLARQKLESVQIQVKKLDEEYLHTEKQYKVLAQKKLDAESCLRDMKQALLKTERCAQVETKAEIAKTTKAVVVAHSKEPVNDESEQQVVKAEIETEKLLGKLSRFGQRNVLVQAMFFVSMLSGLGMLLPSMLPSALAMGNTIQQSVPSTGETNSVATDEGHVN